MQSAQANGPVSDPIFQSQYAEYFGVPPKQGTVGMRDHVKQKVNQLAQEILSTIEEKQSQHDIDIEASILLNRLVWIPESVMKLAAAVFEKQYRCNIKIQRVGEGASALNLLLDQPYNAPNATAGYFWVYITLDKESPLYVLRPTYVPPGELGKEIWADREVRKATDVEFTTSDKIQVVAHSFVFKLRCPEALKTGTTFGSTLQVNLPDVNREILEIVLQVLYKGTYKPSNYLTLLQILALYRVVDKWNYNHMKVWVDDQLKSWLGRVPMDDGDFRLLFPLGLGGKDFVLASCCKYIQTTRKTGLLLEQVTAENFEQVRKYADEKGYKDLQGPLLERATELLKSTNQQRS